MTRIGASVAISVLTFAAMVPAGAAHAEEPTGSIAGHITKEIAGQVTVNLWTTTGASAGQVRSDADGDYVFTAVAPGTYKVQFGFQERWQWAHQKLGFSAADVVGVSAGATAVVDETLLPPGALEVVATDAATGQPVNNLCAGIWDGGQMQCGATDGVLRLTEFGPGPQTVYIRSSDGLHARTQVDDVTVVLGQITRLEVSLRPTAAITTTVVDRLSGQPLPDVCVAAVPTVFHQITDTTCEWNTNFTDADGRISLGELNPGEYTLIAVPHDDIHGAQWVGRNGGTGSQYSALKVNASPGALSTVANIRLDGSASITGTVNDAATGEPLPFFYGCASVVPGSTYGLSPACSSGEDGKYVLTNLGPYAWPVQFFHYYGSTFSYGNAWSGGASDRKTATLVQATPGTPTEANGTVAQTGPRIRFDPRYDDGQRYDGYLGYTIYNARTGDLIASGASYSFMRDIAGLSDQNVKITFSTGYPDSVHWHGGSDFASAKTVKLVGGNLATVKVVVTW